MTVVPARTEFARIRCHRLDTITERAVQHGLRVSPRIVSDFRFARSRTAASADSRAPIRRRTSSARSIALG
jgi:hypothetical protein